MFDPMIVLRARTSTIWKLLLLETEKQNISLTADAKIQMYKIIVPLQPHKIIVNGQQLNLQARIVSEIILMKQQP